MDKDRIALIEELAREKLEGKSYGAIRAELKNTGMSSHEIGALIRKVDERVLAEAVSGATPDKARQWYHGGLFLAVAGLALSIAYNAGIILKSLPPLAVYAPFIAGILVMIYGKMLTRRTPGTEQKGPGPIRRKRPYK